MNDQSTLQTEFQQAKDRLTAVTARLVAGDTIATGEVDAALRDVEQVRAKLARDDEGAHGGC